MREIFLKKFDKSISQIKKAAVEARAARVKSVKAQIVTEPRTAAIAASCTEARTN